MRDATHYLAQLPALEAAAVSPERIAELAPRRYAMVPLDPTAATGGDAVPVRANHGRWVAECPDCRGAQLAHVSDRRFLCNYCGNVGNGRRFRPVVWPKDHERIAALLDARADESLRNWSPGETVAALTAENDAIAAGFVSLMPEWAHPRWEGHTHRYPKKATAGFLECRDCGLEIHESIRAADIEAAR